MRGRRAMVVLLVAAVTAGGALFAQSASAPREGQYVALLTVSGAIDPISASYLEKGIAKAERGGAALVVIELDTPGGMLAATNGVIEAMLASRVPIAVYVAPAGARAASAGLFLAMAAQVAAMAPGTNIGAAHAVAGAGGAAGGSEGVALLNDAVAKVRALASLRGRNVGWAAEALSRGLSLPVGEAVAEHVVDLEAGSLPALLTAINGRSVTTASGKVVLHTAGLPVASSEMGLGQRFLSFLVNPNIAYILFLLGIIGLVFELHAPGIGLPGVLGGILLVVSLVAFGNLAVSLGGVVVIVLALALFIVDLKAPTHGILTAGGAAALLVGSFLLFPPWHPAAVPAGMGGGLSPIIIVVMTVVFGLFFVGVVRFGLRSQHRRVTAGSEALVGQCGTALSALAPRGIVKLGGEEWSATAVGDEVAAGEEVQVLSVEGVHLVVMKTLL